MRENCFYLWLIMPYLSLVLLYEKELRIFFMRKIGSFPKKGYETIEDVEKLIKNNKRGLAIYCYRLINAQASLKTAVEEVDNIRIKLIAKNKNEIA